MPTQLAAAPRIVLASTSRYRRELLARVVVAFDVFAPQVDETAAAGEAPRQTALRLAREKAAAIAARAPAGAPGWLVIGSDQIAELDGKAIGKPGTHAAALAQLERMQGRAVEFHTALALADTRDRTFAVDCVATVVRYRNLARPALDAYLRADQPYDCAGAARIESLGIALVESVRSDDPTALVGLPLIRLVALLAARGVAIPAPGGVA